MDEILKINFSNLNYFEFGKATFFVIFIVYGSFFTREFADKTNKLLKHFKVDRTIIMSLAKHFVVGYFGAGVVAISSLAFIPTPLDNRYIVFVMLGLWICFLIENLFKQKNTNHEF